MSSELTLALPKYVALKADAHGKYLRVEEFQGRPRLLFTADEISDPDVTMEIIVADNGNIRVKHTSSGKFWNLSDSNIIFADGSDADNDGRTLFRPFKLNSQSIGLVNMHNNQFCRRFTNSVIAHSLNANINFTIYWARLKVEEPVMKREISNIKYNLDKSRVYDHETVVLIENSSINRSNFSVPAELTLTYKDVRSTVWKTNLALRLESKAAFHVDSFPIIVDGEKVELLNQDQRGNELDESLVTIEIKETVRRVDVPPRTKVVVSLIAVKAKCDVPFSFTQSDTLYDGNTFETEVEGDSYTVSNYYDLKYDIREEPA